MSRTVLGAAWLAGFALVVSAGQVGVAHAQTETRVDGTAGNADAGKDAYRRYCVGCHGPAGDGMARMPSGSSPSPGTSPRRCSSAGPTPTGTLPTDEDLFHSVSRGFVTTNMPPWLSLSKQTRVDLVAYIKTFSDKWQSRKPGTPITIPAETPATAQSIVHGREVFQKMECWKCHGPAGHGNGPAASTLTDSKDNPIRPYNFATGSRFKCGETNQDLYRIFMTGLDGTPMPSFADQLQPADAWDLVHFLRTLQPLPSPEAKMWQRLRSRRTR